MRSPKYWGATKSLGEHLGFDQAHLGDSGVHQHLWNTKLGDLEDLFSTLHELIKRACMCLEFSTYQNSIKEKKAYLNVSYRENQLWVILPDFWFSPHWFSVPLHSLYLSYLHVISMCYTKFKDIWDKRYKAIQCFRAQPLSAPVSAPPL